MTFEMTKIVENVPIQIKCAKFYMKIYNSMGECYEHTNSILENILFLSSLILLGNGVVLGTNLWISIFK